MERDLEINVYVLSLILYKFFIEQNIIAAIYSIFILISIWIQTNKVQILNDFLAYVLNAVSKYSNVLKYI